MDGRADALAAVGCATLQGGESRQNRPSGKPIVGPHYCAGGEHGCGDVRLVFVPVNMCEMTEKAMVDTGCLTSVEATRIQADLQS